MRKALIIVDPQNDFFPSGPLGVPNGDEIISPLNRMISHAVQLGWLLIVTRDWHPKHTAHFKVWAEHCVEYTPGANFHADLVLPKNYILISKGMSIKDDGYSPFEGIDADGASLHEVLQAYGITTLYVGGLATDYCVRACVLDAQEKGYETIVLADAVRAVNIHPTDGYAAFLEMRAAYAHVTETTEVLYEKY
jgi:nicotinamidase/pyrazinamidase